MHRGGYARSTNRKHSSRHIPFESVAVADLCDRCDRICIRFVRTVDAAADYPSRSHRTAGRPANQSGHQRVGRYHFLCSCGGGWYLRLTRRLLYRSFRPAPRTGVEHPALCLVGSRGWLYHVHSMVPVLAMLYVCWGLCGVCGSSRVALGVVPGSKAAREGSWVDAGIWIDRRPDGHGCLLPDRYLRRITAGDTRWARGLALYLDVRHHSRASTHSHSSLPSGVGNLARKEGNGSVKTPELWRTVPS